MGHEDNYWLRRRARFTVSRRRMLGGMAVTGAGLLAAGTVGCGDDDDDDGGDSGSTATTANGGPTASGTRSTAEGDRVVVGIGSEPTTADAHNSIGGVDNFYLGQIFNGLYELDYDGRPIPALAESAEVTPDGMQITFKLRDGVKFHNGDPFTSEDVVYSIERFLGDQTKGTKTLFVNFDRAEAPDPMTVVYHMKTPDAGFVLSSYGGLYIVPKAYTESVGFDGFGEKPVGTGAYKLKQRTIGQGATFERFEEYYRGKAAFKVAEMQVIPDGTSRLQMLQVGDIDVMAAVPPEQLKAARGFSGVKLITQPSNIDTYYAFGVKEYPDTTMGDFQRLLGDKRVRQALNYAIDKKTIAEAIYSTELARPYAVTNPDQPWHIDKQYDFDPNRAKQLLSEAGAADGKIVQYALAGDRLPGLASLSAAVASNLRDVGLDVDEMGEEYNAWLSRLRNDTPPFPENGMIFSWASTAAAINPFTGIDSKWTCASRYGHWCDTKFDDLIAKAKGTFNDEERTSVLREAMDYMFEEAPALWLVLLDEAYGIREDVVANWRPRSGSTPVLRLEDLEAAS